jgi:ribosomal protein L12E/L44/L45/RPP1/RPP2
MATPEKRMKAIRRVLRRAPPGNIAEAVENIAAIASGKIDVDTFFKAPENANLQERLEAGKASRSPMASDPKPEKEEDEKKKRKEKPGRDRKERGGAMRTGDLIGGDK